ncbi:MAG: hypothetical protein K5697_12110 [Lachnospiraceae bacterium]|nr:hypothetical protein [Lachnospiraceae bacterium]
MSNEELYDAIRNFQREYLLPDKYKNGNTDGDKGDILYRIDNDLDEIQMMHISGEKEKEAAYVKYMYEMASEEFL